MTIQAARLSCSVRRCHFSASLLHEICASRFPYQGQCTVHVLPDCAAANVVVRVFQLIAPTCLYLALKTEEMTKIKARTLAQSMKWELGYDRVVRVTCPRISHRPRIRDTNDLFKTLIKRKAECS